MLSRAAVYYRYLECNIWDLERGQFIEFIPSVRSDHSGYGPLNLEKGSFLKQ